MSVIIKDLAYVSRGADVRHRLDMYLPRGGGLHPVVLWVHGGSWVTGDKSEMPLLGLVSEGVAVVSMNYRYLSADAVRAPICDVQTAIRFVRSVAGEYGLDTGRFIGAGFSAGAHLVALATLAGGRVDFDDADGETREWGAHSAVLGGAAVFGGVYDLTRLKLRAESGLRAVLNGEQDNEFAVFASPVTHVRGDVPPFFIQHGADDDVVSPEQSRIFAERLEQAGARHSLQIVPNLKHKMKLDAQTWEAIHNLLG